MRLLLLSSSVQQEWLEPVHTFIQPISHVHKIPAALTARPNGILVDLDDLYQDPGIIASIRHLDENLPVIVYGQHIDPNATRYALARGADWLCSRAQLLEKRTQERILETEKHRQGQPWSPHQTITRKIMVLGQESTLQTFHSALKSTDFCLRPAHSTEKASQLLRTEEIQIIVVDMTAPDFQAEYFVQTALRYRPSQIVVAYTTRQHASHTITNLPLKVTDLLSAPCTQEQILQTLNSTWTRWAVRQENTRTQARSTPPHEKTLEILLAENNPAEADLVKIALSTTPKCPAFRITNAPGLGEVLDLTRRQDFDVIITDLSLHDSSGIETFARLRASMPGIPIVVLTGSKDPDLSHYAMRHGAQDYLHKGSLDGSTLLARIQFAIERQKISNRLEHFVQQVYRSNTNCLNLITQNRDGILITNTEGQILFANPAAENLLQRPSPMLMGRLFSRFVLGGLEYRDTSVHETTLLPSSGQPVEVEVQCASLYWEGKLARMINLRDITDRKKAAEYQKRLMHANRLTALGQLAAGVAHEINNPATFIMANLSILQRQIQEWTQDPNLLRLLADKNQGAVHAELEETIQESLEGVKRISKITRTLRDFSYLNQDEVEKTNLADVVRSACALTRNQIHHQAQLQIDQSPVPLIPAHRGKLVQVVTNLLINARDAIQELPNQDHLITVRCFPLGEDLVIEVEDTGPGIPEELHHKIFEPFFTTKERGHGTGLGLPLMAEIVHLHSGTLTFRTRPGKGTCFRVSLPVHNNLSASSPPSSLAHKTPEPTGLRMLLIDDEPLILRTYSRVLRKKHTVVIANNGQEALNLLRTPQHFDVILCDLMMQDTTGADLYEILEKEQPETTSKMIFFSGGIFTDRMREFVARISNPILQKPMTPPTLMSAITSILQADCSSALSLSDATSLLR